MTYRMIQRCRTAFPIRMMCRCLRVSPSGYYGWATRPPSGRAQENARLLVRIHQLHAEHDGVVGSPRIWEDLRYAGERCGRHRVARLMRRAGLQGVPQRRQHGARSCGSGNSTCSLTTLLAEGSVTIEGSACLLCRRKAGRTRARGLVSTGNYSMICGGRRFATW